MDMVELAAELCLGRVLSILGTTTCINILSGTFWCHKCTEAPAGDRKTKNARGGKAAQEERTENQAAADGSGARPAKEGVAGVCGRKRK
jgi:hypothetical protein